VELDEALKAKIQDIAKAEHLGSSGDADWWLIHSCLMLTQICGSPIFLKR
jgi:hypothetical protein